MINVMLLGRFESTGALDKSLTVYFIYIKNQIKNKLFMSSIVPPVTNPNVE